MFQKIQEQIVNRASYLCTKPLGLFLFWVAALLFLIPSLSAASVISDSVWLFAIAMVGATAATGIVYSLVRPPEFLDEEVGLLLAIRADSTEAQDRIESDIASALLDSLRESNSTLSFNVQSLQQFHARNVTTDEVATHYAIKTRARFVLYGSLSKRESRDGNQFVLRVEALATHAPTTRENQSTLITEMKSVLPLRTRIDTRTELEGLELAGQLFGLGALYVISVVLFISGDISASIRALSGLTKRLQSSSIAQGWTGAKKLKELAPQRLLDFRYAEIDEQYFRWRGDHEIQRLRAIEEIFDVLPESWKKDLRYLSIRAICHFVLHRNVHAARALLRKVGEIDPKFPTWRYSLAFLAAYEDNIPAAKSLYQQAFAADPTTEISLEVEEFLHWVYDSEPAKIQMIFFSGLINLLKKQDYQSAKRDFEAFLSSTDSNRYTNLRDEAREMLEKCESHSV